MKRKFLEDLGLESDAIEKIMAEAGKEITALKAKVDDLSEQITVKETTISEKNNKIAELEKVDVEAIKKDAFEEGKKEGSKDGENFRRDNSLTSYLKDKCKAKDPSLIIPKLDMEKVKFNDNFEIVEGLEEQVNTLKKSHDYLFENDKPLPQFSKEINQPKGNAITKEAFQKMSYKDRVALKNEQPEVYQNLKNE